MVSKVAVIALVAIIAVPIMMGYALNLSEVAVTEYKPDGEDPVNVTELLQSGTAYTTAKADAYKLNSSFKTPFIQTYPIFESTSTTRSSLQLYQNYFNFYYTDQYYFIPFSQITSDFFVYVGDGHNVNYAELADNGNTSVRSINNVVALHYYYDDHVMEYEIGGGTSFYTVVDPANNWLFLQNKGTGIFHVNYWGNLSTQPATYANIAAGYHFENVDDHQNLIELKLPDYTNSVLVTVDLDSITDQNYSIYYGVDDVILNLEKSGTSWKVKQMANYNTQTLTVLHEMDLYYNPSGRNVYQFIVSDTLQGSFISGGYTYYHKLWHIEFRYVGNWPTLIGPANYYQKFEYDYYDDLANQYYNKIRIGNPATRLATTPIMRMDGADFRAFAYNIISDQSYSPADFRSNPTTTLNVSKAGSSLVFGGNTYPIDSSGNITLGTHKVSVNKMQLESTPVQVGYENKINGTVVSVTAQPSTITFNGEWGASVSTIGNVVSTYNHTEWTPGVFAWDGLDQNFLMVGLLAALGVFIALGIAYRQVKSAIFALIVVCGGAMLLFITML